MKPLASSGGLPNDARVNHKPHHKRHHRHSERNQIIFLAGFVLLIVLALLVAFLWWMKNPKLGSP
jgi:heme/copper-type cytochrome/quinol oxidase subunit 4